MTKPLPDPEFHRQLMMIPVVIIESPYKSDYADQHACHIDYLAAAIHHSMLSGEAPFASHGFYPDYLREDDDFSRKLGIRLGQAVMARASFVAVYCDLGISPGMKEGIRAAHRLGLKVERRKLGAPWKKWRGE